MYVKQEVQKQQNQQDQLAELHEVQLIFFQGTVKIQHSQYVKDIKFHIYSTKISQKSTLEN